MKFKLFYFIVFICFTAESQEKYTDIIKPRVSFVSEKAKSTDLTKWVVIDRDTFYSKYKTNYDLSYLDESLYAEELFFIYEYFVFQFTDENSEKAYNIFQWSTPIVVYLDKKIPETVRKQFEDFFSQINNIDNLRISFTSKLENANYFIKTSSKIINGYKDDFKFSSEEKRKNSIYTGITFEMSTDNNHKYYSCILTINTSEKDDIKLLQQLKQLFFVSLGKFSVSESFEKESLFSTNYDNNSKILDSDLDVLRVHYGIIYDREINGTTFKKLIKLSKQNK